MRSRLDVIRSRDWIELAFKAKFKPSTLASLCNVSVRQLERYFDEAFHLSPRYWLNRLRVHASAQLIMQKESEKEIAFTLAFANVPHFVREFKRQYGCTPTGYMRIESARSAVRSAVSPEMRALEEWNQRALLHPRDERALLTAHRERTRTLHRNSAFENDGFPLDCVNK